MPQPVHIFRVLDEKPAICHLHLNANGETGTKQLAGIKSQKLLPNYRPWIWREIQSAQLIRSYTDFDYYGTDFVMHLTKRLQVTKLRQSVPKQTLFSLVRRVICW